MSNKYSIELAYDDAESPIEYLSVHGRVEWADKRTALKHARKPRNTRGGYEHH